MHSQMFAFATSHEDSFDPQYKTPSEMPFARHITVRYPTKSYTVCGLTCFIRGG
jgi:hypothetical protein